MDSKKRAKPGRPKQFERVSRIMFVVDKEEKDRFFNVCRKNNISPSDILRGLVSSWTKAMENQ